MSEDLVLLSEVLGYGPELANALDRYAKDDASGRNASEGERARIRQAYSDWMRRCPHFEHLCFADLTFFSDDKPSVRDALTIVIVPEVVLSGPVLTNHENYTTVLRRKYLASQHTMAPHSVFAMGLPRIQGTDSGRIQRNEDLSATFSNFGPKDVESQILFGHLENRDCDDAARPAYNGQMNLETQTLNTYEMNNFEKEPFNENLRARVSDKPILDQWEKWLSVWQEEADGGRQLSSLGGRPYWMLAAPVGLRRIADLDDFSLVSCVFLAFDGELSRSQVIEALRYILLHLYEANAATGQRRRGEVVGRNAALLPALHEVKNVIKAIVPQLSPQTALILQDYFSDIFVKPATGMIAALDDNYVELKLYELVHEKILQAAKIERLAQIAQRGMFLTKSQQEINDLIESFAYDVLGKSKIIVSEELGEATCKEAYRDFLSLAILGAFRNAIYHGMIRNTQGKMFVNTSPKGNYYVITIENECVVSSYQLDSEGKPSGTISALRGYARAYDTNSNLVMLCRTGEGERDGRPFETWKTEFPLPDMRDVDPL